ncbi:hypothetical protein PVAP13_3KG413527 [Panicum virgatum]|uniref:Uncharacterized protein n=1 Tax=Panicum virgatum TaxID=38727 RepID=A0A8T0V5L3_PANVG|nr:hypothetical protein PVAP13_3KG413527 [Panicum virgatum]
MHVSISDSLLCVSRAPIWIPWLHCIVFPLHFLDDYICVQVEQNKITLPLLRGIRILLLQASWMAKIALYGKYVCRPTRKQIILLAIIGSVFARPVSCSGSLRPWIHLGFVLITEPGREEELKRWGPGAIRRPHRL